MDAYRNKQHVFCDLIHLKRQKFVATILNSFPTKEKLSARIEGVCEQKMK